MIKNLFLFSILCLLLSFCREKPESIESKIWSASKANEWYAKQPWMVGADFLPSTAINQLEMWQAASFDSLTIDKEFGWAAGIGMNIMRIYLHDLAWQADPSGFKSRMEHVLALADKHHIKILFTIFDDCWNPTPLIGTQPAPMPGIHNSGWVRSPHIDTHHDSTKWAPLENYVKDILNSFKNDERIFMWDLYNEPANSDYGLTSFPLLQKVFEWGHAVRPSQPLTVGVWFSKYPEINAYQLAQSDIISFHNYGDTLSLIGAIDSLKKYGRPIVCTEYMARTNNSKFVTHLPIFKRYGVAAINWGLVSGKSNTIYPWGSKESFEEPPMWFHDVFRKDGTSYDSTETLLIKSLTGR